MNNTIGSHMLRFVPLTLVSICVLIVNLSGALCAQADVSGVLTRGEPAPAETPQTLRCVTYNVLRFSGFPARQAAGHFRSAEQRTTEFAKLFGTLEADVFALQESPSAEMIRSAAETMGFHSARTAEKGYRGGTIISRYPIVEFTSFADHQDDQGLVFSRHFWRALLDVGGGQQVLVYGTHFNPAWDIAGEIARLREVRATCSIMKRLAEPDVPEVLLGDFNVYGETSQRFILNSGLRDCWSVKPTGGQYTCNSVHQYCRVDRIYISAAWSDGLVSAGAVRNKWTSPTEEEVSFLYSDHLPVRAEFLLEKPAVELTSQRNNDIAFEIGETNVNLKWVAGGTFTMGHDSGVSFNQPLREVQLEGFWILPTEVSERLWHHVLETESEDPEKANLPVVNVSRSDCYRFLDALNKAVPEYEFQLPTEAQWEYVARSGRTDIPADQLTGTPPHNQPKGHVNHRVAVADCGENAFGIRGMMGNVREWCRDAYHKDALTFLSNVDPLHGPNDANEFSIRGSSYLHEYGGGIVTRVSGSASHRDAITGFRIVATRK